jgi:hypothetical protein
MRRRRSGWTIAFWAIAAFYILVTALVVSTVNFPRSAPPGFSLVMVYLSIVWSSIAHNAPSVAMLVGMGVVIDRLDRVLKDGGPPKL